LPVSVTRITMHFRDQRCRRLIAVLHHGGCERWWSRSPLLLFVLRLAANAVGARA
jgi:hypothetical protein